jgi:hypothetical protein
MKVLHFPVGGRTQGGKNRDGLHQHGQRGVHVLQQPGPRGEHVLQQPGPRGEHVLQERYRAAREPQKADFSCPGCGAITADSDLIRIGYCGTCLQPTGLCPVGRDISLSGIAQDMGELCSAFGVSLWEFDDIGRRLVCPLHDLALANRRYVWIHGSRVGP